MGRKIYTFLVLPIICDIVQDRRSITLSHGSAYTVVRAMQQVTGKWQFWGCQNSLTPELID